jgi:predicted nucleic acid-binding protein
VHAVIDTSIASQLYAGLALDPLYDGAIRDKTLAISFQTVEEMLFGAVNRGWGEPRRQSLEAFLRRFSIVTGDWALADVSAKARSEAESQGRRLEAADAWIVATAIHVGLPLITDDKDQVISGLTGYSYVSRHDAQAGAKE